MEPMAAAALTCALSRQFSRTFITLDSQQGSPFSDSMTLRCSWLEAAWKLSLHERQAS